MLLCVKSVCPSVPHPPPGVDGECAGSGVHAGDILAVFDLFLREFYSVIPVAVAEVLPNDRVSLIRIKIILILIV